MHTALWITSGLALAWLVSEGLSALARRNERRALERLRRARGINTRTESDAYRSKG
jgi:hypothetical protein